MAKHIGIIGVTPEGAALCYKAICSEASKILDAYKYPEITLHQQSFDSILAAQNKRDWPKVASLLLESINKVASSGAEFAVIPANSVHYAFKEVQAKSPIPLISIVDVTVEECKLRGYDKIAVIGTGLTMSNGLYEAPLKEKGIETIIPEKADQEKLNEVIFNELVHGKWSTKSVDEVVQIIGKLKIKGCKAVVLACTEIPLIINEGNSPLPCIDTIELLAKKAVELALK